MTDNKDLSVYVSFIDDDKVVRTAVGIKSRGLLLTKEVDGSSTSQFVPWKQVIETLIPNP